MNRNQNYNRNRYQHQNWDEQSYNRMNPDEGGYRRGHSHYRNEGDFGSQNSVRGYGNYGNMGSYGGAQGYGEANSVRQGYYGRPYGDENYQQLSQRPDPEQSWSQEDSPYGDWRENAGYYRYRQPQGPQQHSYYGSQGSWSNPNNFDRDDYPRRGRSYGPGNIAGGAYMGSGYNRISEGEYGPMLGDEGSESAFSRLNGGYSSRGGISHPGNSFNTITHSMWDEDINNDYGASFGDDIEYNPYEASRHSRRQGGRQEGSQPYSGRRR